MNIIVPIHVEALRVAPSTTQQAKTALYDFTTLGNHPLSSGGGLIAAKNFQDAQSALNIEPGIHLHWSLPKAYTRGVQAENGALNFPSLPNRWLIFRFFKNNNTSAINIQAWILESDAHSADKEALDSDSLIPWMNDPNDMFGMDFHYAGNVIPLGDTWTEPGAGNASIAYLLGSLQAPMAYGETFSPYYKNSSGMFGFYDDFQGIFSSLNFDLEANADFTVSYSVMGWVSPQSNDKCIQVLNEAISQFNKLPSAGKPSFTAFIQENIEQQLKWELDDYTKLTPTNSSEVQGILSGLVANIQWKIVRPGQMVYPSALPDASGISTAIGNNTSEALSAYLNQVEGGTTSTEPGDVNNNMEWLLNALQFGRLQHLGKGEMGIAQLDEYLHNRSFASHPGGALWTVRNTMTPGSKANPMGQVEAKLPLPLAKILSQLNNSQHQHDTLLAEIASRQQKLFFDWNFHINAIEQNLGDIQNDNSRDLLMDGMMQLFSCFTSAGDLDPTTLNQQVPYTYSPTNFQIQAPADTYKDLPHFIFNQTSNVAAEEVVNALLQHYYELEGLLPNGLGTFEQQIENAVLFLEGYQAGSSNAQQFLDQAIAMIKEAQKCSAVLLGLIEKPSEAQGGLGAIKSRSIDPASTSLADLDDAIFEKNLKVNSSDTAPLPPGKVYTGSMASFGFFGNVASWESRGSFPGMGALIGQFSGTDPNHKQVFDIQQAAISLARAHFWRLSGDSAVKSTAYYVQLAQEEVKEAAAQASQTSDFLSKAITQISGSDFQQVQSSLSKWNQDILPALLQNLEGNTPNISSALQELQTILDGIKSIQQVIGSDTWKDLLTNIEQAWLILLQRLPAAQQVSILNTFLHTQIQTDLELAFTAEAPFWSPMEPVVLMGQEGETNELLKPVNRNGRASLLPCRWDSEVMVSATPSEIPAEVGAISTTLKPGIPGLPGLLQKLTEENFFLSPDTGTNISTQILSTAAANNKQDQLDVFHKVKLEAAPQGLTGTLPYYIAFNWRTGKDPFLPLFIFWQANYQYSQEVDFQTGSYPGNFMENFALDSFEADNQVPKSALPSFARNDNNPNFFELSGVISLSSASTAQLNEQIRQYCLNNLNYDPGKGAPNENDPNFEEKDMFFKAYKDFISRRVLSQGLAGFNPALVQRAQEIQLPLNIPSVWVSQTGHNIPKSDFWPTQFLKDQSKDWSSNWNALSLNFDAFLPGNKAVSFNPLRAGFLEINTLTLVDSFGRFVKIPNTQPPIVAESMQNQAGTPNSSHTIYLPPRLTQPGRVQAKWLSASSPDKMGDFTEWNPHPASSPICGWVLPNHLDNSLAMYNADGKSLGSLRSINQRLRWFTVPGEVVPAGMDNRALMVNDLQTKGANAHFSNFLETFAYADSSENTSQNFLKFLSVIDAAQQFIITKSMQEDQGLAVLVGQPLVLVQATVSINLQGKMMVSLDHKSYPPWNGKSRAFQMDGDGFIPYNFQNFNDANIPGINVPLRIGEVEYAMGENRFPYFDDGLVGFFIENDFGTFYTPVNTEDAFKIISSYAPSKHPVSLKPNGNAIKLTFLMDPRAAVHITTGILPLEKVQLAPDLYTQAMNQLTMDFLTAPVLKAHEELKIPVPAEKGFEWFWWQVGAEADIPITPSQVNSDAFFPNQVQEIIDGWLKLKKQ